MKENLNHPYSKREENLNIITHGLGFLATVVVFPFLGMKAVTFSGFWKPASFIIYGLSLMVLYAASTCYHAAKDPVKRRKLNIFDHSSIYLLIAGSYSPFCLVGLDSEFGWYMFLCVWTFALIGVVLKFFFTGKYDKISTAMYLLMGWQVLFFIKPLMQNLSENGLTLLILGGIFYSIGAILYSIRKLPYNHAIFHVFVLAGSISHFLAIYNL
jgi:hemolysin III